MKIAQSPANRDVVCDVADDEGDMDEIKLAGAYKWAETFEKIIF